jgi:hypothetical protein
MLQPLPIFLAAFYLLNKGKPVRRGVVCGLVAGAALPLARFDLAQTLMLYKEYVWQLFFTGIVPTPQTVPQLVSLPSTVLRWMPQFVSEASLTPWVIRAMLFGIAAIFFVYVWSHSGTTGELKGRNETHLWALAAALMVLLDPGSRPFCFIFLVPAFCSLIELSYRDFSSRLEGIGVVAAFMLVALSAPFIVGNALNMKLGYWGIPMCGMALLCLVLAWGVNKSRALYV